MWHVLKAIFRPLDYLVVQVSLEPWGSCSSEAVHSPPRACRSCGIASSVVTGRPSGHIWCLSGRHVIYDRPVSKTIGQSISFHIHILIDSSPGNLFVYSLLSTQENAVKF